MSKIPYRFFEAPIPYAQMNHPRVCGEKSARQGLLYRPHKDHPCVCGEKLHAERYFVWGRGSPLRVRGKDQNGGNVYITSGITPACAGKRKSFQIRQRKIWDHPRVCGEKLPAARAFMCIIGSPPRVRGKGLNADTLLLATGITPACAGKRKNLNSITRKQGDHPRVCGEKLFFC